jgi:hypothetical protein
MKRVQAGCSEQGDRSTAVHAGCTRSVHFFWVRPADFISWPTIFHRALPTVRLDRAAGLPYLAETANSLSLRA